MNRIILSVILTLAFVLSVGAQTKKPVFTYDRATGKWGFKPDYGKEWIQPPMFDSYGSGFNDHGYAIVRKDGKYNALDLNLNPILPEWSEYYPDDDNGLIVITVGNRKKLYDISGKLLLIAADIRPLHVWRYRHLNSNEHKMEKQLIGYSVGFMKEGPFFFYDVNAKKALNLSSASPITSEGGILLFTNAKRNPNSYRWEITSATVTDAMGNELDTIVGHAAILNIEAGVNKVADLVATENLYDGYMPCYVLQATTDYKGKGNGVILGREILKKFSFTYSGDLSSQKKGKAKKVLRQPEMVALYKEKVLKPLQERLEINKKLLTNVSTQAKVVKVNVIPYNGGYALSTDGKNPMSSNKTIYESLEPIGNKGLLLGKRKDAAEILSSSGIPVVNNSRFVDFQPIGKNGKFIAALTSNGRMELFDDSGNSVTSTTYDDIMSVDTPMGEVLYFVNNNQWNAWAPGFKETSPKMRPYHYVGIPDSNGNVETKYNGFSGTYNMKTGVETSPVETLFDKAYKNNSLSDAKRVEIYSQVIALDRDLREGYTGAALNNIGAIYEDAGYEDTAYEYYERSMDNGNKTGEKNYKRIRNNRRLERIAAVANAISGASQSALNAMSGGAYGYNSISGYNTGYGDISTLQADNTSSSGSGYSASFYQEQYTNWERRAQSAYESLTTLGSRTKRNGQETSGSTGQSMSSSNYTRQKQCLREAQREMQSIRSKARKDGVTIPQSHWETVTVSY